MIDINRIQIIIHGAVQGVGFRPWVYQLAAREGVKGRVHNDSAGVIIDAFGSDEAIDAFMAHLGAGGPPAAQIRELLNSEKDEFELNMCTDVDRNDKSRVCEPGSVKVIGRRQIEMYSRLIHTVDHIEGRLRDDMDAFDGFLSHAWAVTVTGAPKLWAPTMSRSATADVASAARVRWDLAMSTG